MNELWHFLKNLTETDAHGISAETRLETGSLWFDGHFPGSPILPGIAQIAIVSDVLKEHAKRNSRDIAISGISRVRFRQFVRPGDTLQVTVTPDKHDPSVYKFRVLCNGQIACNGLMATAPRTRS
ncbi:MAG: hypothetical protein A2176_02080 [Spirochaetes bacterium RBG_13_51_14]|nr:MAG: hypothetical protein A2176_02080 [Spirochaetes bacterium RBG_13_51_14]